MVATPGFAPGVERKLEIAPANVYNSRSRKNLDLNNFMTQELKDILTQLVAQINNWNRGMVTNEDEFLTSLKDLAKKLSEELEKPQEPPKTEV